MHPLQLEETKGCITEQEKDRWGKNRKIKLKCWKIQKHFMPQTMPTHTRKVAIIYVKKNSLDFWEIPSLSKNWLNKWLYISYLFDNTLFLTDLVAFLVCRNHVQNVPHVQIILRIHEYRKLNSMYRQRSRWHQTC